MARPGIMLYFDILEPIRVLPDEDKGRLLIAILEYGQDGTLPKFDGMLAMAWGFVRPKIDRDGESYENTTAQRKFAAFCKKLKARGLEKIEFEEWMALSDIERERLLTTVTECNPTTTVPPSINTNSSLSISSTSNPPPTGASSGTTAGASAEIPLRPSTGDDFEKLRQQAKDKLVGYTW